MNISLILLVVIVLLAGASGCATITAERDAPMAGKLVEVSGENIHVLDLGTPENADPNKPPVVLIHGASANLLDMNMSLGEALRSDRRVVLVDRPGRGYSERPEDGYRLDVQARYIHEAIAGLGLEKPIIVGQSFGGAVALSYGLQYQDDISGLVLLAAVSHEWEGGVAWYNEASQIPVVGFLLRRLVVPLYGQIVVNGGVDETFAPDTAPAKYVKRSGLPLLFRPRDFRSNAADIYHLKSQIIEQQDRYGELTLPVAIITGTSDTVVSPDIHSKTLAGEVEGASLTLLPETGHALHHTKTNNIVEIINNLSAEE